MRHYVHITVDAIVSYKRTFANKLDWIHTASSLRDEEKLKKDEDERSERRLRVKRQLIDPSSQ